MSGITELRLTEQQLDAFCELTMTHGSEFRKQLWKFILVDGFDIPTVCALTGMPEIVIMNNMAKFEKYWSLLNVAKPDSAR